MGGKLEAQSGLQLISDIHYVDLNWVHVAFFGLIMYLCNQQ